MLAVGTSMMIVMLLMMMLLVWVQIMIVIDKEGGTVTMISIMLPSPMPSGNCSPPSATDHALTTNRA